MARPVHADADATRRRILESAVSLFADRGLDGASVRDVASGADVSLAMVSHYFGSKDDLYGACVAAMYEELLSMRADLERELDGRAPLDELFARAVTTTFRFARAHRTAVRLLMRAATATGEVAPPGRQLLLGAIDLIAGAVERRTGRPAADVRLPVQSLVFLVARYAAQDEGELAAVAGLPPRERRRAVEAVEAHLVGLALTLLTPRTRKAR